MNKKAENPSWLSNFTNLETKIENEPFKKVEEKSDLGNAIADYLVISNTRNNHKIKKVAYALRIEEDINEVLDSKTQGSKNSVINALLKYAINDLKEKNKTLYS